MNEEGIMSEREKKRKGMRWNIENNVTNDGTVVIYFGHLNVIRERWESIGE